MKIHHYENAVLVVGGVLLLACLVALFYASYAIGVHLPGHTGRVDPLQVHTTPPFDRPGARQIAPKKYEVVLVGQMWSFNPAEIRVPAGSEVTFMATSADVVHGLHIARTKVNLMLIPGQISRNTYTFREPGEHLMICHEYCGLGHHTMAGKVVIE